MTTFANFLLGPAPRGRRARPTLLAACLLGLAACGGGGSGGGQDDGKVPASAWDSPQAFTHFVAGIDDEGGGEPLSMDGMDLPPTSETAEPEPWA